MGYKQQKMKENQPQFENVAEETFHLEQEGGERKGAFTEELEDTDTPQGVFFKNQSYKVLCNDIECFLRITRAQRKEFIKGKTSVPPLAKWK